MPDTNTSDWAPPFSLMLLYMLQAKKPAPSAASAGDPGILIITQLMLPAAPEQMPQPRNATHWMNA